MKRLYYSVLVILAAVGAVAVGVRLSEGLRVTALTSPIAWGMWVAFYIYFIGLSAGSFLLSTLVYVFGMKRYERTGRMALLSALFALAGGLLFVWIDLGHPMRFWHVFKTPNFRSVLAWEMYLYLLYIVLILGELWLLLRGDLARLAQRGSGWRRSLYGFLTLGYRPSRDPEERERRAKRDLRWVKVLGIIGVPTAVGVHGGTGAIFAVVKAKPYWFSGLFPIIFLVSALASGAALLTFLYAFFGRREEGFQETLRGLAQLLALFIGVDLLMVASDFLVHLYGAIPEVTEVLRAIIAGPYWYTFWGGQIFLGAVVPLLILALPGTRRSTACLGLAGLSAVAGIVGVRLNLVIPAYIHPLIRGLEKAYQGPRLSYSYFPSGWEWASSVGIIAFVALLFSIAFEFLPMQHQRGARP